MDVVDPAVEEKLRGEPLAAFLATSRNNRPHVAPVWYRYDDGVIEVSTAGQKLKNLRANPRAAVSVHKAHQGDPEWSVTALGTASIHDDPAVSKPAIRKINRRYGMNEDAWIENTLVRIDIATTSLRTY